MTTPLDDAPAHRDPVIPAEDVAASGASVRRRPPRRKGYGRWVGAGVFVAVIALIASTASPGRGSAFVYSKYVDEVMADPRAFTGADVRVEGTVEPGSLRSNEGASDYRFRIERNHRAMPVSYHGIVPDTFREGIGVTVRGRLGTDGEFVARELVAKCPSKYEMQAAQQRGERMPHAPGGVPLQQP